MSRAFIQKRLPFKPTDIGGCQLWLDAADVTTMILNGTKVTQWNDKSISGYNFTQATSGNKPTYSTASKNSLNTITFTSANSTYLLGTASTTFMGTNSISVYGVFKINNNTSSSAVFSKSLYGSAAGRILYGFRESGTPATIAGGIGVASGPNAYTDIADTYTAGAWRTFGFVSDRSGWTNTTYQNGTSIGAVTISSDTTTNLTNPYQMLVGAYNNSSGGLPPQAGYFLDGAVGELLVFNTALTTAQRQQIESYLAQKWGLQTSLPQGHPGTRGIVYPSDPVNLLVRVPYPVIFTPLQIQPGTCQLWLDGADPAGTGIAPANGTVLTSWIDKSGKSKNATGVNSPTVVTSGVNSLSVVSYNGSSYSYSSIAAGSFPSGMVIFIVYKVNGAVTYCAPITRTIGNMGYPIDQYNSVRYMGGPGGGSSWSHASATSTTLFSQIILTSGANILSEYVNGTSATVTGSFPYYDTASYIYIGTRDDKVTSFNGYMCEAIVYNAVFTTTQRQQVEGYLAWKWGLQGSLDASNPYKNAPPNITNQFGISRPPNVLPIPPITISARSKAILQTRTFTYTGSLQDFIVPSTISPASVNIYMWGAGGGTSQTYSGYVNYNGGAGAMVQGVYTVTPGSTLYIVVGLGGSTVQSAQTDAQGGGGGVNAYGGGGGGRSAIQLTAGGADVVVAGGGGGGGLLASNNNGTGGPSYYSGTSPATLAGLPAYGGSQTAGGAGTSSPGAVTGGSGSLKFGGTGTNNSCSGGGGYYGGGGSGNGEPGWDPGAGGSSLIDNLTLIPGQSVFGYNSTNLYGAPNTGSPYYQSNIAAGGIGGNATGGNGLVVITYYA